MTAPSVRGARTDSLSPRAVHDPLIQTAPRTLAYRPERDYPVWRRAVRRRLVQLLGVEPERVPLDVRILSDRTLDGYRDIRFVFTAERHADVPCHLLLPTTGPGPFPTVICLQGHSTGMHLSVGEARTPADAAMVAGGGDFARQAVREGYAALVIEQRAFGERAVDPSPEQRAALQTCTHPTMAAMLLGRTMIGERVWDVRRAIDALETFSEVDPGRIGCMGVSGGGTITWFAACMEPRISIAMPGAYVCSYTHSIGPIGHCPDNYLPSFLRWFDLGDTACLIAPRPLVVVAGRDDPIFPLAGVEDAFATIGRIYAAAGAPHACRLEIGEGGHTWLPEQGWAAFRDASGWPSPRA